MPSRELELTSAHSSLNIAKQRTMGVLRQRSAYGGSVGREDVGWLHKRGYTRLWGGEYRLLMLTLHVLLSCIVRSAAREKSRVGLQTGHTPADACRSFLPRCFGPGQNAVSHAAPPW